MRKFLVVFSILALALAFGSPVSAAETLMMATTTSTDDTGILEYLAPEFQKDTGIELKWTGVGTGKALEMGKNCDVSVLLVHAPSAEKKFVDAGYGVDRRLVMYNDFIIIGPESDPAKTKGLGVVEALKAIAGSKAPFISRGDKSGTHVMELSLWKEAGLDVQDKADWYVQAGQGMLAVINIAGEKNGYTLTDRGTYIKYENTHQGAPPLKILVEKDKALFNQYSVIAVNSVKCKDARQDLATKFADWLVSEKAQKMIADFKLLDKQLFTPNAAK
ncbi:MAG: substrate-binding domain-containing protein [Pseudomonadota bacterium]